MEGNGGKERGGREGEKSVMRLRDGLQNLYLRDKVFLDLCVCNGRLRERRLQSLHV